MKIPGANILNVALSVIASQSFQYYAFLDRTANEIGLDVTSYKSPVMLRGSVQPVPRNLYSDYGLDFDRYYVNFYLSKNALDVERDVSGDQITFNSRKYQVLSKTDWFAMDGWVALLTVQIPIS